MPCWRKRVGRLEFENPTVRREVFDVGRAAVMLLLLGCTDTLTTPDGDERVRGALWIDAPVTGSEADAIVLVSNTPIPCEADEVPDDPNTPADETAGALQWWEAQLTTAATREGSVILAFWLFNAVVDADFTIDSSRDEGGWAVGYRVVEAALEARDGPYFFYTVEDDETEWDLAGDVSVVKGDESVQVTADLGEWATEVDAERCDNTVLVRAFYELIAGV